MAATTQNTSGQPSGKTGNVTLDNDSVRSLADALATLPQENKQTMKEFLDQQMESAKNVNDELVEQFGSAIDNSEFASSMNEVKESLRKSAQDREKNKEAEERQEFFRNIQNDLDKILEHQGDVLRADVTRGEVVSHDTDLNEVENKPDEKADEETDVVKEDIKPIEVKVDVQLPEPEKENVTDKPEPSEPSKEENLLNDLVSAQEEQNTLLADIGKKLPDIDETKDVVHEKQEPSEPSKEENLLTELVSVQAEQNSLLTDIGKKLPDVDETKEDKPEETKPEVIVKEVLPEKQEPSEPSKEENLLTNLVAAQAEQNSLLSDIGEKLSKEDEVTVADTENAPKDVPNENADRVVEVNETLGKINDSLDDILDQFGETIANMDVNEPPPVNVQVNVDNKEPEREKVNDEQANKPQKVELSEDSLNTLREYVDTAKMNDVKKDTITDLANDISGATDSMNNQDETPLERPKEDKSSVDENKSVDHAYSDQNTQFYEKTEDVSNMDVQSPILDRRMDMAARMERDVTPSLNEVQMFNRMSLTKEEIQVLASEIGKAVRENLVDREGDRARDAAYLEEVERIVRS